MRLLLTTDLHLTARPEHTYRIEYLSWLAQLAEEQRVDAVAVLGDLSDAKDFHSGNLVNAVADAMVELASERQVLCLYGNHDGPSPDRAYWQFLDHLPRVSYFTELTMLEDFDVPVVVTPWGCEAELVSRIRSVPQDALVLMHATVDKAVAENGFVIEHGSCPNTFLPHDSQIQVYSGDIHVPQRCGDVEYVGAPYHTTYGSTFTPRTLLVEGTKMRTFHFPDAPRLHTVRVDKLEFASNAKKGDRVKLVATLKGEVLPADWQEFVRATRIKLEDQGIELTSALLSVERTALAPAAPSARRSDESIVRTYAEQQEYEEAVVTAGVEIVKS